MRTDDAHRGRSRALAVLGVLAAFAAAVLVNWAFAATFPRLAVAGAVLTALTLIGGFLWQEK